MQSAHVSHVRGLGNTAPMITGEIMYDTAPYRPLNERTLVPKHAAHDLPGTSADATDRYDLMRAIRECDRAIEALSQIRAIHTANLCRVANRLAFDAPACREHRP